jgi:hypothetical protein
MSQLYMETNLKIKDVKNFNKETDVLVVNRWVWVHPSIKTIRISGLRRMAVIRSAGTFSNQNSPLELV